MQAQEQTAVATVLHPPQVWEQFFDDIYPILTHMHLENFFYDIRSPR